VSPWRSARIGGGDRLQRATSRKSKKSAVASTQSRAVGKMKQREEMAGVLARTMRCGVPPRL